MTTAFAAFRRTAPREGGLAPTAWFAYGVVGVLLVAHGLGIVVAGEGEYVRCMSWPTEFAASGGFEALRNASWIGWGGAAYAAVFVYVLALWKLVPPNPSRRPSSGRR